MITLNGVSERFTHLSFPLSTSQPVMIGRGSKADFRVRHYSVSRKHAVVQMIGERWFIRELGSKNGTFVDGHHVNDFRMIEPGDDIRIGAVQFEIREERGVDYVDELLNIAA